jgi:YD repeat-containing protein
MKTMYSRKRENPRMWRPLPLPMRGVTWFLIVIQPFWPMLPQILSGAPVPIQTASASNRLMSPPPAPQVTVNRTIPDLTPPSTDLKFSDNPTDEEIFLARVFTQPIISIGKTSDSAENKDLAVALLAYHNRQDPDDGSAIENFLETHPNSPRYLSLMANLATHFRETSQFSKALGAWQRVWALGKNVTDENGMQVVDNAVADWATFLVTLGRTDDLKLLLSDVNGRNLHGSAATKIFNADNALWQMENQPAKTFKCGPYSLWRVEQTLGLCGAVPPEILTEESTTKGTTLYQNWLLSQKIGLKYQMAKRQPGAEVPLPAVVHWKLGHFSALTKIQGGRYRIEDPTFNQGFISPKVLDEESDGYYLIPAGPLPPGWSAVSGDESKTVFGKSAPKQSNPGQPGPPPCNTPCCTGMARYHFDMLLISLAISDTPLFYTPPRGPEISFNLTYCESAQYPTGPFSYSNLGNNWGFSWLTYIADNSTNDDVNLVLSDGSYETFYFNSTNSTYAVGEQTAGQLTKVSSTNFQCLYPDGSMTVFSQPDGTGRFFMTTNIDPAGNAITFRYDSQFRLTNVIDAIGQVTTLHYGLTNDIYKITQVTDPFGRSATFQYNGSGQLTNITDIIGISSAFTYGSPQGEADFINSLTTPYGTTTFVNSNASFSGRWIVASDPLGVRNEQNSPRMRQVWPSLTRQI